MYILEMSIMYTSYEVDQKKKTVEFIILLFKQSSFVSIVNTLE